MRNFRPSKLLLLLLTGGALCVLPMSGCGNGGEDPDIVIAPIIQASFLQTSPTQTDRVVFMDKVTAAGNIINADLVVTDTTGTLDLDDFDLVLRYDASFIQVTDVRPETLFGRCGTVNTACNLVSPICLSNLSGANAGGARFCRINGSTLCLTDADCPSPNDACGNFGKLSISAAVVTGPKTCSNKSTQSCNLSLDCKFCSSNLAIPCVDAGSCTGTCTNVCSGGSFNGLPCSSNFDCLDTCNSGTCSGCPAVLVNGTARFVNLTMRLIATGVSDVRFVISANPSDNEASFLRKDTAPLSGIQFWPSVDSVDPSMVEGSFTVTGTK